MSKQVVNVTKMEEKDIVEGRSYYFMVDGKVKKGTAVQCEECGKFCSANSVTIISFNKAVANIRVAPITSDELGYNEDKDMSVCSDCDK